MHGQQQHTVLSQSFSPMGSELPRGRQPTPRKPRGRASAAGARPRGRHPGAGTVAGRASQAGPYASRRSGGRPGMRVRPQAPPPPRLCRAVRFPPLGFCLGSAFCQSFFFPSFNSPGANWGACVPRRPLLPSKEEAGTPARWPNSRAPAPSALAEHPGHRARARLGRNYLYVLWASPRLPSRPQAFKAEFRAFLTCQSHIE